MDTPGSPDDSRTASPALPVSFVVAGCSSSSSIEQLVGALAQSQTEFGPIEKDKTAKITSTKGNYSYDYADLATVLAVVRPVLSKNGIAVFQPVRMQNGHVSVSTVLAHVSGQWIANDIAFKAGEGDPRSVAGIITYARRYGLITMTGVAPADEDDDAAQVSQQVARQAKQPVAGDAPEDFEGWVTDLRAVADEGNARFYETFNKSRLDLRMYLTRQRTETWEALKGRASTAVAAGVPS
jgi:hypothetical protein